MLRNLYKIQHFQRIPPIRSVCQASVLNSQLLPQRHVSTNINFTVRQNHDGPQTDEQPEVIWRRVFHFHVMKDFAAMTKLKFYPLGLGVAMVPISAALQFTEIMSDMSAIPPLLMGICGSSILCGYSKLLSNTVAIINACPLKKNLQIIYIDFMGNRKCIEATVNEVKQMEQYKAKYGLYKVLKMRSNDFAVDLKVPLKQIHVYDVSLYRKLFGKRGAL